MFALHDVHARTAPRIEGVDRFGPFADESEPLAWRCPVCGKLRVFEGGRPTGADYCDDCPDCGCRLAVAPVAAASREPARRFMDA